MRFEAKEQVGTVIICHTPLHCLLAAFICVPNPTNRLFFISDANIDYEFLRRIASDISARLVVLPGSQGCRNIASRLLRRRANLKFLKRAQIASGNERLLIFNDVAVEDQFAIHVVSRNGSPIWLGEDGVAIYDVGGEFRSSKVDTWLGKLLYGTWWSPKRKIGADSRIHKVFAACPSLVTAEVAKGKDLQQLVLGNGSGLASQLGFLNPEGPRSNRVALVILPVITAENISIMKFLLRQLLSDGFKVVLKFHPRERRQDKYMSELDFGNLYGILPDNIPCELAFFSGIMFKLVIGFRSSALHLIKAFFPEIDVRFWESSHGAGSSSWRRFYKQVEVSEYL
ncbi:hypothetical protein SAMN04488073_0953 [Marinobacter gudaonensis]|uniref:CDP-Glycerol:Poly(Glycerophosphate) glycerophosphotransferase n=1 Tax=Marinobacter gudaonensis TaxID=375760 RepID=A0A1I6GJB2_9GAMM|nr:polysialyltransferase family glycosyltransferase [Marinobacter gudaonensis]SFR42303.1 hypothetical protein SAMN04488073_0953 [Marinobacter gudaonensis]